MHLSTLLPLTLLALATATPLPTSSQDGALEIRNPTIAIIDPLTSQSTPTTNHNSDAAPINKRSLNPPNTYHDPAIRSAPLDDMALMDNSLNDVFILKKMKRGFWAKFNKWWDCDVVPGVADNDGEMDSGYCS